MSATLYNVCVPSPFPLPSPPSSSPPHLSNVLWRLLQVPQLGHGVVAERLVQWTISKFISDVHVGPLLHQQLRVCVCWGRGV